MILAETLPISLFSLCLLIINKKHVAADLLSDSQKQKLGLLSPKPRVTFTSDILLGRKHGGPCQDCSATPAWVQILVLKHTSCVTSSKLLGLFKYLHLENKDDDDEKEPTLEYFGMG